MATGPALTPEVVAAHAGALRALALSLVGDEHAADDVLQDTFVRALVAPPPRRDRIGGWLARVAHGFAIDRRRAEARRAERERRFAAERPEAFDADARGEVARSVVEAVVALREPYKTTVLLRYFEGLGPREIAARLSVSVATVDSRLQRAHALLRERLERDLASRQGGASAALLALAGSKAPVAAGTASAWALAVGGFAVTLKSMLAGAAILLALLVSILALRAGSAAPARPGSASVVAAVPGGPALVEASPGAIAPSAEASRAREVVVEPGRAPLAAPDPRAPEPGPYEFDVEIVPLDVYGHPLAAVDVWLAPARRSLNYLGSTAWDGTLRRKWRGFEREIEAVLVAKRDGFGETPLRRIVLSAGRVQRVVLALDAARGIVVADPDTGALADSLLAPASPAPSREHAFRLDEAGNGVFLDPWLCPVELRERFLSRVLDEHLLFEARVLHPLGYAEVVEEVALGSAGLFEGCASIEGAVVDRRGKPVAGVLASVVTRTHAFRSDTRTDADGRFWLLGVPCGPALVLVGDAEHGFDRKGLARNPIELVEGETSSARFVLDPPPPLAVRLVDEAGTPLAGWHVEARTSDKRGAGEFTGSAVTDAEGVARIAARTDASVLLFARPARAPSTPKSLAAEYVRPGAGEVVAVVPGATAPGSIAVRVDASLPVVSQDAAAFSTVDGVVGRVALTESVATMGGGGAAEVRAWRVDSGEGVVLAHAASVDSIACYAASGLIPGRYEIEFGAPQRGWRTLGTFDLEPGASLALVARGLDLPASLTLGLVVRNEPGPRVAVDILTRDQGAIVRALDLDRTLPATLPIAPGDYEVEVACGAGDTRRIVHREHVVVASGTQSTLGIDTSRRPRE